MKLRGKQLILLVSTLVLCCSVARSQTFSTSVQGVAITCTQKSYSQIARGTITDQVSDSCPDGSASSSATATLDDLGAGEIAQVSAQNGAGATARAESIQTATLKPPKGFTGNTVQFSYKNYYGWSVSGVGPGTGFAKSCIGFAQLSARVCQLNPNNGSGAATMHGTFKLTKSSKGFQLTILEQAYAEAAGNAPPPPTEPVVSVKATISANPTLILPKGWTCKYDSGSPCP
jgi:hypothetical protein